MMIAPYGHTRSRLVQAGVEKDLLQTVTSARQSSQLPEIDVRFVRSSI